MKILLGLSFFLSISFNVSASETFAGIYFDSSIPNNQTVLLKNDLKYLFKYSSKKSDTEFNSIMGMQDIDGQKMYNWIFNRVNYIIGQEYNLRGRNLIKKKNHVFPTKPLPPSVLDRTNAYAGVIIMSNMGAELYLTGKLEKVLKGIRLDRKEVMATSPRVGILQVGEGLFLDRLAINNLPSSEANTIKRLGTIFHEARHSDGHSEHIGFIHSDCPTGHPLAGFAACETYANGAYTLEALALKKLLTECKSCSITDKTKLTASIADSKGRVILHSHVKTEEQLLKEISSYTQVIEFYIGYIKKSPNVGKEYVAELERLKKALSTSQMQLKELKTPVFAKIFDPTPEGIFKETSQEITNSLIRNAIKK